MATRPMPTKSIAESVLPGLNPYQPNQRISPPLTAMVRSCGSIGPPPSRLNFASEPWAENDGAGQRNESADGMNDRRAGEIMEAHAQRWEEVSGAAHRGQPAIRSPSPVSDDRIDETGDADAVEKIADESGATDHRARGDRRAGIGEGELEDPDCQERDARGFVGGRRILAGRTSDNR